MGVTTRQTFTVEGRITLQDLRDLVERTRHATGTERVEVQEPKSYSPMDNSPARIEVTVEVTG